jgi:hypothetical protein
VTKKCFSSFNKTSLSDSDKTYLNTAIQELLEAMRKNGPLTYLGGFISHQFWYYFLHSIHNPECNFAEVRVQLEKDLQFLYLLFNVTDPKQILILLNKHCHTISDKAINFARVRAFISDQDVAFLLKFLERCSFLFRLCLTNSVLPELEITKDDLDNFVVQNPEGFQIHRCLYTC